MVFVSKKLIAICVANSLSASTAQAKQGLHHADNDESGNIAQKNFTRMARWHRYVAPRGRGLQAAGAFSDNLS
jgi:hypothetical protein